MFLSNPQIEALKAVSDRDGQILSGCTGAPGVNAGSLKALARQGLIADGRPDRGVYWITQRGRESLAVFAGIGAST